MVTYVLLYIVLCTMQYPIGKPGSHLDKSRRGRVFPNSALYRPAFISSVQVSTRLEASTQLFNLDLPPERLFICHTIRHGTIMEG